ncbi:MAG: hypothetical protein ACI8PZ_002750 [Myxococcota bacterium]|jgi:hypothetical protein
MTATPDVARERLRAAASRAVAAHHALAGAAAQLIPDDLTESDGDLAGALAERDEAILDLGRSVLRVLLLGGQVDPQFGASPASPDVDKPPKQLHAPPTPVPPPPTPEVVVRKRSSPPRRTLGAAVIRPPSKPATAEQLQRLAGSGLTPNWTHRETETETDPSVWRAAIEVFGPPPEVTDIPSYDQAIRRLVTGVQVDQWKPFPRDLQKCLVGYASSISRYLQDEAGPAIGLTAPPNELATMFSVMTRWSDVQRPGFVSGLSRRNPPDHGSWAADAAWWWGKLQRHLGVDPEPKAVSDVDAWAGLHRVIAEGPEAEPLLGALGQLRDAGVSSEDRRLLDAVFPHAHLLDGVTVFKTLRKKLARMAEVEDEVTAAADERAPIPEEWPLRDRTEGKIAAVLGGDPRPRALARLKDAFGFEELTWEIADGRRTQALADRVRRHSVDMVIVLRRFVSHKLTDVLLPACRTAEVPFVVVDTGYGVAQTRMALERYLS